MKINSLLSRIGWNNMPTPTLEELLALKEKMSSLPSFQKETEENIVSDALASPVRPEYIRLLEEEKKNQPMAGFTSPEERAIKQLNEYDRLRETPSGQKSVFDDARLADFKKRLNPSLAQNNAMPAATQDNARSAPFYPTPTGAAISEKQLDVTPTSAAAPKRALASTLPAEKQTEDSQIQKILQQPSEYEDLLTRFRDAQERQRMAQLGVGLTQAAERVGSAIAMIKPGDQSVYEQAMKQAGGITEQFKEEETMAREAKRQDPKSSESEAARQLLKEQGITVPDTVSAAFIEKQYPQFASIIRSKEDAKREDQRRRERQEDKDEERVRRERLQLNEDQNKYLDQRQRDFQRDKTQEAYLEVKRGLDQIDDYLENPNPVKAGALSTYLYGKINDPTSAIREQEQKLFGKAGSIRDQIRQFVSVAATGKIPVEKANQFKALVNAKLAGYETSIKQKLDPLVEGGKRYQLSPEQVISNLAGPAMWKSLYKEASSEKKSTIKLDTKLVGKAGKPFTDPKTGKRYVVNPDEETATEL